MFDVVHAAADGTGRLLFWGERLTPDAPATSTVLTATVLVEALRRLGRGLAQVSVERRQVALPVVPSDDERIHLVPSRDWYEAPSVEGPVATTIDVVVLDGSAALTMLRTGKDGARGLGSTMTFWRHVAAGAAHCCAEGLVEPNDDCAGWRPLPCSAVDGFVEAAATAAPDGAFAEPVDKQTVVRAVLASFVDGLAPEPPPGAVELGPARGLWSRRRSRVPVEPLRLCLELREPDERDAASWTVDFLIQSRDDPTLLVPAARLWGDEELPEPFAPAEGAKDGALALLAHLDEAAVLPRSVFAEGTSGAPAALSLTADEAALFLSRVDELREDHDVAVLLPATVRKEPERRRAQFVGRIVATGQTVVDAIAIEWCAALGDDVVSLAELERLTALKRPMIKLAGCWVAVPGGDLQRLVQRLRSKPRDELRAGDLVRLALDPRATLDGLPVRLDAASSGEGGENVHETVAALARRIASGTNLPAPLDGPPGFGASLRPYQRQGLAWLVEAAVAGLGVCLADDMGLGKTVQTLALLAHRRGAGPSLIVCPTSVVTPWARQAAAFAPQLSVLVHHGAGRVRTSRFVRDAKASSLVVTTYGTLRRDAELLQRVEWDGVVLDEAQLIKNDRSKAAKAARELRSHYRLALTGTPVENHLTDLWALFRFLVPGLLGPHREFRRDLASPIEMQGDDEARQRLHSLTAPFILRRVKSAPDVAPDLPEKVVVTEPCRLTVEQATLYQAVVDDLSERLATTPPEKRKGLILGVLTRLKQICNHPAQILDVGGPVEGRSGKLRRLDELVEAVLAAGERALIFTQYTTMGRMLVEHLEGRFGGAVPFLHGGLGGDARRRMVDDFQSDGGPSLFVISLRAGGTGLTLTRANHVVHFDRWWNPAVENQATDRAHRIGQQRTVVVRTLVCEGTIEERIDAILAHKQSLADDVVGDGASADEALASLADEELTRMLRLTTAGDDE